VNIKEVNLKDLKKEKDVLEQIEEGVGDLKCLSLVHPDSLAQPQTSWRPPSPLGPPPALPRNHQAPLARKNRTEGRSATDDQYIHKLEKEITSLRTQNHAYVKEINELRIYNYTQQVAQDDRREDAVVVEQPASIAGSEYNANAIPKPRRRAGAAPRASSSDVRLATF
jgi:hypothetical protein